MREELSHTIHGHHVVAELSKFRWSYSRRRMKTGPRENASLVKVNKTFVLVHGKRKVKWVSRSKLTAHDDNVDAHSSVVRHRSKNPEKRIQTRLDTLGI